MSETDGGESTAPEAETEAEAETDSDRPGPLWAVADEAGAVPQEAARIADRLVDEGVAAARPRVLAVAFEGVDDADAPLSGGVDGVVRLVRGDGTFRSGSAGVRPRAAALRALADASDRRPGAVLVASTPDGDELAAVAARRLRGGCVTDCLLRVRDGELRAGRTAYEGRAYAELSFERGPPVVSLNTAVLDAPDEPPDDPPPERSHEVEVPEETAVRRVDARDVPEQDLERARRIVAGGYGLGGPDGFEVVRELADALGASVGASRPPADEKWVPYDRQIGVTGKEIDVALYVPTAISGDPYHMRSVNADHLVPINVDRGARIFNFADLGVVGDVFEYGPVIADAIREASGDGDEGADGEAHEGASESEAESGGGDDESGGDQDESAESEDSEDSESDDDTETEEVAR